MTEPFGPWSHGWHHIATRITTRGSITYIDGNHTDIGPINHDVSLRPWITTLRHRFVTRLGEQFDRALTAIVCKRSKP